MYHKTDKYSLGVHKEKNDSSNPTLELFLIILSYFIVVITFPLTILCIFQVVAEYERAVIFRLGKIKEGGVQGPGLFFVIPFIDTIEVVDLRTVSLDMPEQEILTRDSCSVLVGAVVYYHIEDPLTAILRIFNYRKATNQLAASTLRNVLGKKTLSDIMIHRESIAEIMLKFLDKITSSWGIKVERVEIKEIRLPPHLQKVMAAEAEAEREAKAKLIVAEGEIISAQTLNKASQEIDDDPMALELRYLESLNLAGEKTNTIIFPADLFEIVKAKGN